MTRMGRAPAWLWIAAATLIAHGVEALLRHPSGVIWIVSLCVAVVLSWLLLHASRTAWVLILVVSVSQLITPFATDGPLWIVALAAVRLVCLLAPSSRDFIWSVRESIEPSSRERVTPSRWHSISLLALTPSTELGTVGDLVKQKALDNKFLVRLAIVVVVLMLTLTPLYEAQQGFGRDSVVVDVVWIVAWVSFNFAFLALIVLGAVRIYSSLNQRRHS